MNVSQLPLGTGPYWVLGIDPGVKGAIAALRHDLSGHRLLPMPMLERHVDVVALRAFLCELRHEGELRFAFIEKAQVMPKQGGVGNFSYGRSYGTLTTSLEFMDVPFREIAPSTWKLAVLGAAPSSGRAKSPDPVDKEVASRARSAAKRALKAQSILAARRMFPTAAPFLKSQDGLAEAMLIAEASRRFVLSGSMNSDPTILKAAA